MGSRTGALLPSGPSRYCWEIFTTSAVRRSQLGGTPYRYWSSFAIAYILQKRLAGRVDFLDAGGRDGGTLELLQNLSLEGTYTCLDLEPRPVREVVPGFEVQSVRSSFKDFHPPRQYDVILFQSCLECVESYSDIAWARDCLKPGGFVVATIACKNTRNLYWAFWAQGGKYLLDEQDLAPAFAQQGLGVVWVCALGGAASRAYQHLVHTYLSEFLRRVYRKVVGSFFPAAKNHDPLLFCYRALNFVAARLDRLLPFWRTGHCVVLERASLPEGHSAIPVSEASLSPQNLQEATNLRGAIGKKE